MGIHGPGAELFTLGDTRTVQLFDLLNGRICATRTHPRILPTGRLLAVGDVGSTRRPSCRDSTSSIASDAPSRASTEITVMFSASEESEWDSESDANVSYETDSPSAAASPGYSDEWSPSPFCYDGTTRLQASTYQADTPTSQNRLSRDDSFSISASSREPDDVNMAKLFPKTKSRIYRARYLRRTSVSSGQASYVKEILTVVFNWERTAEELVKEEISHTVPDNIRQVLLARWLVGIRHPGALLGGTLIQSNNLPTFA